VEGGRQAKSALEVEPPHDQKSLVVSNGRRLCENAVCARMSAVMLKKRPLRSTCGARSREGQGVEDPRENREIAFSHSLGGEPQFAIRGSGRWAGRPPRRPGAGRGIKSGIQSSTEHLLDLRRLGL
jgi:hypothetical protein